MNPGERRPEGVWAQIIRRADWMNDAPTGVCPVCGDHLPVRHNFCGLYMAEHMVPGHPEFTYDGTEYTYCRGSGYPPPGLEIRLLSPPAPTASAPVRLPDEQEQP